MKRIETRIGITRELILVPPKQIRLKKSQTQTLILHIVIHNMQESSLQYLVKCSHNIITINNKLNINQRMNHKIKIKLIFKVNRIKIKLKT